VGHLDGAARLQQVEDTPDPPRRRLIDVQSNKLMAFPLDNGTVALFNAEDDEIVETYRLTGLAPRVEAAAFYFSAGYLYVFDSGGQADIIEILPDNTMRKVGQFHFPNIQGPIRVRCASDYLVALSERRNRMLVWSLLDPLAPTLHLDETFTDGMGWEQNPVRDVLVDSSRLMLEDGFFVLFEGGAGGLIVDGGAVDFQVVRKFGTLQPLLGERDWPVTQIGSVREALPAISFDWALHGDIAGLSHTVVNTITP
jgi:hypothetical protein